ncbi:hypothetical protein ACHHYP_00700 [Achlya hypogyna]|uniref:Uncharacterized protein n=1 Tax=Achlya hypogyna TaxID=1202772 RepID=A0A1V9ZTX6_ACHHY|nr:hypothetical protein ACHHYP_00700 [Achlya hypogyna]
MAGELQRTQRQVFYDVDDELLDDTPTETRRARLKLREAQRRHRQHHAEIVKDTQRQFQRLWMQLSRLRARKQASPPELSWKDIAEALRGDTDDALALNNALRQQLQHHHDLAAYMMAWVSASIGPTRAMSTQRSWRETTLLADPTSRQLGIQWIVNNIYFNLPRLMDRCGFPSSCETYIRRDVTVDGNTRFETVVKQRVENAPFHVAARAQRSIIDVTHNPEVGFVLETIDPDLRYVRFQYLYGNLVQNTIVKFVEEPGRLLVFTHAVQDDALFGAGGAATRYWSSWYVCLKAHSSIMCRA